MIRGHVDRRRVEAPAERARAEPVRADRRESATNMDQPKSSNIQRTELRVNRAERELKMGHRGVTIWLTGLSGSGKSTIAAHVDRMLTDRGVHCWVLDGDNVRFGLNSDLGFSPSDRNENIRRVGEVAKLFTQAGVVNLVAFISPYREDRDRCRTIQETRDFVEAWVECPLEVCEQRDPKGLYAKARAGQIKEFTGISAPYEAPDNPELVLRTDHEDEIESARRVVEYLEQNGYLTTRPTAVAAVAEEK